MKPKVFSKKLSLNKKTIAHLNGNDMKEAHGGIGKSAEYSNCIDCTVTCGTCFTDCGTCNTKCGSCDTNQTIDPLGACCC